MNLNNISSLGRKFIFTMVLLLIFAPLLYHIFTTNLIWYFLTGAIAIPYVLYTIINVFTVDKTMMREFMGDLSRPDTIPEHIALSFGFVVGLILTTIFCLFIFEIARWTFRKE